MSTQTLPASVEIVFLQQRHLQHRLSRQFETYHDLVQLSIDMAAALRQTGRYQRLLLRWYQLIMPLLE